MFSHRVGLKLQTGAEPRNTSISFAIDDLEDEDPNPRVDKSVASIQDPVRNRNPLKSPSTPEEDCGQNV